MKRSANFSPDRNYQNTLSVFGRPKRIAWAGQLCWLLAAAVTILAILTGCAGSSSGFSSTEPGTASGATASSPSPPGENPGAEESPAVTPGSPGKPGFTLVYSINNGGYVGVCGCEHKQVRQGSLPRRANFLKQLSSSGRTILLLDGGSALFPIKGRVKDDQMREKVRNAEIIVEAYNRMGYRAMAVGAFDIAAGLDNLKRLEKRAKFPFLSANLVDEKTGKRLFPASAKLEVGGVRVGIIGLTLETLSKPYLSKVAPNIKLLDPIKATREALEELGEDIDLVVALAHVREETNFDLVKEIEGVHILIDPFIQYTNHRTWIKADEWLSTHENTLFLRGDGQGARLGVVDLELPSPRQPLRFAGRISELLVHETSEEPEIDSDLTQKDNRYRFARVSLEPHHQNDPATEFLIAQSKKGVDPAAVKSPGGILPTKEDFLTHAECETCHEKQYTFWTKTSHFNSLETLRRADSEENFACLGCHALGYGLAFLDTSAVGEFGSVQCESCHGTNPGHIEDPKTHRFARVRMNTCITCHNKEVTQNEFGFASARRKVACPKG